MPAPPADSSKQPTDPAREQWLAEGLIAQDNAAVVEFLERTHHPVYCMAGRLTRDPELRRDWTHEVLLGILSDLRRGGFVYRRPGSFWAWFRKRAYFRLIDQYRRMRRHQQREVPLEIASDDDAPGALGEADARPDALPETSHWPTVESDLAQAELVAALEDCIAALPNEQHRRAVSLLLVDEWAYEAIATELGAPLNTVRAWIRRGRLRVRACLVKRLGLEGHVGR